MTSSDLSKYDLGELKGLLFEIDREIEARQQSEVKKAREQILAIAQKVGIPVEDLVGNAIKKAKAGTGTKARPQYLNPADNLQTWSGRGRQPRWVSEALANGKTLNDLKISG